MSNRRQPKVKDTRLWEEERWKYETKIWRSSKGAARGKQRSYRMLYADVPYNIKYGNPIKIKKSLKWQSMHKGEGGGWTAGTETNISYFSVLWTSISSLDLWHIRQAKPPQPAGVASTRGNGAMGQWGRGRGRKCRQIACAARSTEKAS